MVLVAFPAIDGPALGGFEGHFAFLTAVRAGGLVELPGWSIPVKRHPISTPFPIRLKTRTYYAQLN